MKLSRPAGPAGPAVPGSDARLPAPGRDALSRMPAELQHQVVAALAGADVLSLALTNKRMGAVAAHHLPRARVMLQASRVDSPEAAKQVMTDAAGLRRAEQAPSLLALGRRLQQLGEPRAEVADDFRKAVASLARAQARPVLSALAQVIHHDKAADAIEAGESVGTVALAWSQTSPEEIRALEDQAIFSEAPKSAGKLVEQGAHVQAVAQSHGITTPRGLADLEDTSIYSPEPRSARGRVRNGEDASIVAHEMGITSEQGLRRLAAISPRE